MPKKPADSSAGFSAGFESAQASQAMNFAETIAFFISTLICFPVGTMLLALPIVVPWVLYSRDRLKLSHSSSTMWLIFSAPVGGGPLYCWAYRTIAGEPYQAYGLGVLITTVAALFVSDLVRIDYVHELKTNTPFRLRLRTLFAFVAVVAFVLATLAPALRSR